MAAQAGLCLAWSETPEDTFCHDEAHFKIVNEGTTTYNSFNDCIYTNIADLYSISIIIEPPHDKMCLRESPTRQDTN